MAAPAPKLTSIFPRAVSAVSEWYHTNSFHTASISESGKTPSAGQPPIQSPAFSLVKASLDLAQNAVHNPEDLDSLWESLRKVDRTLSRVETTLHRGERYR